ncbi:nicotinate-nucleotide--dimethylbenzimidazole phosphoribosyltransferase, partial [Shigella sonnei]|uniref:nicotinate-nucleotide--dimethylbenzimidazole phosphoribosyltransferase n=1 Tax=Shigella sonnei TaxID=624 RepID=UPI000A9EC4A9
QLFCQMSPAIKPYLIPSHLSAEKGARIALSHLGLEPYLNMEMRLGEGSGAALAMPIIEAACAIYNNMGELFLNIGLLVGGLSCLTIPCFAWLADRFGRRRVYITGALIGTLSAFPFFMALGDAANLLI